jgi:serine/threonine-protein kinase
MSDHTRIDSLVMRYEALRDGGTPVMAEELCRDCPELLEELKRQIRVLESMNALLGGAEGGLASGDTPPADAAAGGSAHPVPAEALAAATRYRVLRAHAAGGLGEVLVAHDEELHRDVALKRLQAPHVHSPQSRSRFLREAKITSRLEHPNVVPVHAVGQDAEGRLFYAMRFVQGETLRQASQHFHAADRQGREPGERRLALRQLLSRFVAVCNTVAYAHSLGIVHRDIKPDNIILGAFGETMLVDWGLAKEMRAPESPSPGTPEPTASEDENVPTLSDTHPATRQGAILGTPGYMSPEQATGGGAELGPASDVYSLGATLYLLLTGEAPFPGRHVGEVLDKVKRGDFAPPRRRKKDIPRALEAICCKAMARQPGQRYASALALAADMEHWLAAEPVSAWREPWTTRAYRWAARHRTLVTAAAVAVLVALVGLTAAALLLNAANRREREARSVAQQQRDEAHRQQVEAAQNFQLARQAVDRYCTLVAQDPRLREYDLEDLRKGLLRTAAQFCDEFVRRRSDDPEVLADQGRAYLLLGFITEETGDKPEAITHYQKARSVFAELARENPAVVDYQRHLAKSLDHLGTLCRATGQPTAAREAYGESLAIRRELARAHPDEAEYHDELAQIHHLLGIWHLRERQWERAKEELDKSLDIRKELLRKHPGVVAYQTGKADAHNNLAIVYNALGQPARVEEELLQTRATWEGLTRHYPTLGDYRAHLAVSHYNLGFLYAGLRRPAEAEMSYKKALELREELVHTHPTVSDYQSKLARTHHALGVLYHETNRPAEAEAAYGKGRDLNKKLTEAHPTVTDYAVDLGKSYNRLGYLFRTTNPQAALELFDQSARAHEPVLRRQPDHAEAKECLGYVHAGRALALYQLRYYPESLKQWDQALDLALGPNRDTWQLRRAITLAHAGEHAKATAEVAVLAARPSLPAGDLYALARIQARSAAFVREDDQLSEQERQKLAEEYAAQAVKLLRRLQVAGYFNAPSRLAQLRQDPELTPLRSRADFQGLMKELEEKERAEKK